MAQAERARTPIGQTGLSVSTLSIGTAALGLPYGLPGADIANPQLDEGLAVLETAFRAGINFVDTAPAYGQAEELVGRSLGAAREVVIASKLTKVWTDGATTADVRTMMRRSVELTLKHVRRAKLDILLLHSPSKSDVSDERVLRALSDIRSEGLVSAVGASTYQEDEALAALDTGVFDLLQVAFNLLDQRSMLRVMPAALDRGSSIVTRSVVLKGALTSRWRKLGASAAELRQQVERVVDTLGISDDDLADVALRFSLANVPPITSVLIGPSSVAELESALAASASLMSEDLLARCRTFAIDDDCVLNPSRW